MANLVLLILPKLLPTPLDYFKADPKSLIISFVNISICFTVFKFLDFSQTFLDFLKPSPVGLFESEFQTRDTRKLSLFYSVGLPSLFFFAIHLLKKANYSLDFPHSRFC